MSLTQQYLLDTYRASRLGVPAPPAPGLEDWQVVRELGGELHRLRAARPHRPNRGDPGTRTARRLRRALTRLLPRPSAPASGRASRRASGPAPRPASGPTPRAASGPGCRPACPPAGTA